ncbi:unnamed protein product [Arctogadus glacialis]
MVLCYIPACLPLNDESAWRGSSPPGDPLVCLERLQSSWRPPSLPGDPLVCLERLQSSWRPPSLPGDPLVCLERLQSSWRLPSLPGEDPVLLVTPQSAWRGPSPPGDPPVCLERTQSSCPPGDPLVCLERLQCQEAVHTLPLDRSTDPHPGETLGGVQLLDTDTKMTLSGSVTTAMVNESRAVGQQAELLLSPTVGIGRDRSWEGGRNAGKPQAKKS